MRDDVIPTPEFETPPEPSTQFDRSVDAFATPPAGGSQIEFPFQILNKSTGGGSPVTQCWVRFGTVMDVEPTNCETDIVFGSDGVYLIYINLTVDINGAFSAVEIDNATGTLPVNTDYNGYLTLGVVTVSGGVITNIQQACTHSLRFAMCGRVVSSSVLIDAGTFEFWGF